jgi:putative membrane protein
MTRLTIVVAATLLASSIATLNATSASAAEPNQDGQLATLLGILSQEEIALGRLAQERASDPQVQQFAQSMVADHQRIVDQLREFHPAGPIDRLAPADAPRQKPESGDGLDYLELHRSVAAKFVDGMTRELRTREGRAFDRAYVETMAVFHVRVVAALEAYREHASPELATFIGRILEADRGHHAKFKTLKEELRGR